MNRVIFETIRCTGCRTCEIACSYHHGRAFSPSISSVEILNSITKDGEIKISFHKQDGNGHLACDGCKGEEEPYCVKYCNILARDELRGFLNSFLQGAR
jgi:Fe-S-cluster-containing hydrogenase component 2